VTIKFLDHFLQLQRYKKADRYVTVGAHLLDIGCYDGSWLQRHVNFATVLVGVDTQLNEPRGVDHRIQLIKGTIDELGGGTSFNLVTALAVLEHLTNEESASLARAALGVTSADAKFLVTVPSPLVDKILDILMGLRLLDGMDTEAHHGQSIEELINAFEDNGWLVDTHKKFQFGLNNLIVFQRRA
jgi:2-polyprenyl-3-methyl-5-hydroxy-6-metoxy-1,4-benzoquinol methylase